MVTTLVFLLVSFFAGHFMQPMDDTDDGGQTCHIIHDNGTDTCQ